MSDFTITPLPQAPSRLVRPATFFEESAFFLDALNNFREEVNRLTVHLNSTTPNYWSCGRLESVLDGVVLPNLEIDGFTKPPEDSTTFVIYADSVVNQVQKISTQYQQYLDELETMLVWRGEVDVFDQRHINYALGVTIPAQRFQQREEFNETYDVFLETIIDNVNTLYRTLWYLDLRLHEPVEAGGVEDAQNVEVITAGRVEDTIITN